MKITLPLSPSNQEPKPAFNSAPFILYLHCPEKTGCPNKHLTRRAEFRCNSSAGSNSNGFPSQKVERVGSVLREQHQHHGAPRSRDGLALKGCWAKQPFQGSPFLTQLLPTVASSISRGKNAPVSSQKDSLFSWHIPDTSPALKAVPVLSALLKFQMSSLSASYRHKLGILWRVKTPALLHIPYTNQQLNIQVLNHSCSPGSPKPALGWLCPSQSPVRCAELTALSKSSAAPAWAQWDCWDKEESSGSGTLFNQPKLLQTSPEKRLKAAVVLCFPSPLPQISPLQERGCLTPSAPSRNSLSSHFNFSVMKSLFSSTSFTELVLVTPKSSSGSILVQFHMKYLQVQWFI
ncbi:uncharacterized protein LOC120323741 [Pipra filicauda]|uniref:Uncharacterized protein LOC120323741 n=1 Tax=Pipra filicauda TaxID=649802 RepID=A0A7R5KHF0_9PASS|nr:uncharacterized protein LOC120323741 [Pipra filicauda]